MRTILIITLSCLINISVSAQNWSLDKSHSKLGFSVSHLMISESEGFFKDFTASMKSAAADYSDAAIELSADVNSINTEDNGRDEHLKSADFFDAAKFGKIVFKSTSMKKGKGKMYKLSGNITMHGVTKPIVLDVVYNGTATHPYTKKTMAGFKVSGKLNRKDFGVGASTPSAMVGDEVTISCNIEFAKD